MDKETAQMIEAELDALMTKENNTKCVKNKQQISNAMKEICVRIY